MTQIGLMLYTVREDCARDFEGDTPCRRGDRICGSRALRFPRPRAERRSRVARRARSRSAGRHASLDSSRRSFPSYGSGGNARNTAGRLELARPETLVSDPTPSSSDWRAPPPRRPPSASSSASTTTTPRCDRAQTGAASSIACSSCRCSSRSTSAGCGGPAWIQSIARPAPRPGAARPRQGLRDPWRAIVPSDRRRQCRLRARSSGCRCGRHGMAACRAGRGRRFAVEVARRSFLALTRCWRPRERRHCRLRRDQRPLRRQCTGLRSFE